MHRDLYQLLRRAYWGLPLPDATKEAVVRGTRSLLRRAARFARGQGRSADREADLLRAYVAQILAIPDKPGVDHVELPPPPL